mmetsp:Transcript_2739/g.4185  ORF Transcript_2739/g.4185 Transcript_2739/m.4185 type:complete len:83 (+) Transcript_2739:73-321(+)
MDRSMPTRKDIDSHHNVIITATHNTSEHYSNNMSCNNYYLQQQHIPGKGMYSSSHRIQAGQYHSGECTSPKMFFTSRPLAAK